MAVAGFIWKGPTRRLSPVSGEESMLGVKSAACCRSFPGLSLCTSVRGYLKEAYTCISACHTPVIWVCEPINSPWNAAMGNLFGAVAEGAMSIIAGQRGTCMASSVWE